MFEWMSAWTRLPSTSFCSLINFGPGKGHGTWGGRRMDRGVRMALKCARPREERWEVPAVYKKPLFFIDRCLPSTHPNLPPHSLACTHPPPQIPPPRPSHLAARPQAHLGINSERPTFFHGMHYEPVHFTHHPSPCLRKSRQNLHRHQGFSWLKSVLSQCLRN